MRYRTLGKTGWKVSAVSMGCWGIGGSWGPVSEKEAIDTIHAALDAGVNFFDTADSYGMGISESFLGHALRGKRDGVFLATKVGNWGRRVGHPIEYNAVYNIINCCHASLHRLGVDTVDLYQCHVASPEHPEVFVEAFESLKQAGKIRHYAISTNDLAALKALDANGQCASCQIAYSIFQRSAEADILPYCREHNIGVLLRGPLAQGLLADKFRADTVFTDEVREKWNSGKGREKYLADLKRVEKLRALVRPDRSMVDVALQFTLAHPAVTCPIPGMKTPSQARQNAAAADDELSRDDLRLIDSICPPVK